MVKKGKVAAFAILICVMVATVPAMVFVQGQIQATPPEQLVELAERAAQHVQNLIDMVNADEEALTQIETVGLTEQFEANVTLYETEGLDNLAAAQEALTNSEDEVAEDSAIEALRVFREVYSSIHVILEAADLQKGHLIENQGMLEAITRELQRIDRLGDILPDDTPQEIFELLDDAEESLNEAKTLLIDGDEAAAKSAFLDAKESISQVYQYLKAQAEESNTWRLSNYCEGAQERIRERFRYGRDQGIDFTSVLQSYGYQSESQFMETLQNMIQTVQEEQNFGDAVQNCEEISQMVQQMEQALNQEINRHQGQYGPGSGGSGSGYGYGGNGGGP
jgi:hypothetical protein